MSDASDDQVETSMRRSLMIAGAVVLAVALSACAAGSAESQHAVAGGALSQLLLGFWHGLIAPLMLIVEVINHFAPHLLPWTVKFYESRGATFVYDIGFYFGLVGSPLLARAGWSRRR
jgi:hypothetical protein